VARPVVRQLRWLVLVANTRSRLEPRRDRAAEIDLRVILRRIHTPALRVSDLVQNIDDALVDFAFVSEPP